MQHYEVQRWERQPERVSGIPANAVAYNKHIVLCSLLYEALQHIAAGISSVKTAGPVLMIFLLKGPRCTGIVQVERVSIINLLGINRGQHRPPVTIEKHISYLGH